MAVNAWGINRGQRPRLSIPPYPSPGSTLRIPHLGDFPNVPATGLTLRLFGGTMAESTPHPCTASAP